MSCAIRDMKNCSSISATDAGIEATMSAIRLARAATKRDAIVKCIGCYHGHVDSLLVQAGSGALTHELRSGMTRFASPARESDGNTKRALKMTSRQRDSGRLRRENKRMSDWPSRVRYKFHILQTDRIA